MSEELGWWSPPIPVKGERIGVTENISHTVGALKKLWQWDGKNPKVKKAVDVCSAYMEGMASVEDARKAFEAAAKATGNLREPPGGAVTPTS